jgi:hypothetical protein
MMGRLNHDQGQLFYSFCLEEAAPAMQEKNQMFPRIVRVQPCIRPLNAAVLAAGPDVIR